MLISPNAKRATRIVKHACGFTASSALAILSARLILRVRNRVQYQTLLPALLLTYLTVFTCQIFAATPPNTPVTNTATASYDISGTPVVSTGAVTMNTASRTPATIELLQYLPGGSGGTVEQVNVTQCGGNPLPAPNFIGPPASALTVPGPLRLAPVSSFNSGDPVFVKVTDYDQNLNALVAETITTTVTTAAGDSELLTLTETGISTGVFIGYIQSSRSAIAANNCAMNFSANTTTTANYTDPLDIITAISDTALVDPFGIVFDSSTGVPINGAIVRIIDNATNLPAPVFCDDSTTVLPQPVTTGAATICDPAVSGGYRFPRMFAGTYRLEIIPPSGYSFPSTVPVASLPPGFLIFGSPTTGASYGGTFVLTTFDIRIDVPLDPATVAGDLTIIKTTEKTVVAEGEFIPYSISIKNNRSVAANNVNIIDKLPSGFRYQAGSARLNGLQMPNPTIAADGRTLNFIIPTIPANGSVTLRYVAGVSAGAKIGNAENIAFSGAGFSSNIGRVSVAVREDLMRSRSILVGRVVVGSCDDKVSNDSKGLANARVLLEDGTYLLTDEHGRWHADNILPGTHIVQLDKDSLPTGYEILDCQQNTRFAGRNYSQFVNVRGGSLWRADFYVQAPQDTNGKVVEHQELANVPGTYNREKATQAVKNDPPPQVTGSDGRINLVEQLPYDADWLAKAEAGNDWLHPKANFYPAIPAVKVAVKYVPGQTLTLKLNGEKVNGLNFDGAHQNGTKTVALALWSGVNIKEGNNIFELTITDAQGKQISQETRRIHYSTGPAKAELIKVHSRLVADGKTQPIIAVRFLDKNNKPVRRGLNGTFQLNNPYQSSNQIEATQRDPLAAKIDNQPRYEVGQDGIALIHLAPTTQTGEAVLIFNFDNSTISSTNTLSNVNRGNQIRAWLEPGQRDWVLVGFAQGTAGHAKLSGSKEAGKAADADEELFDKDRVAFYAKGTVKGDTLLTIAYDTAKKRGNVGANANLKQVIDPAKYYTLYADATQPYFDAASARKLYLKLERKQFYAMFGDYDTGLTVTEFSRYSRTANGIKSEFKNDRFSYNAFATQTAQAYKRDDIQGNGTSGLYRLSSGNVIENSDKIRVETRDRFRSEIIVSSRTMSRFIDYDIDYNLGTVFFKQPVASRDQNLNPTYIVAEYESNDRQDEKITAGGRAAVKPNDKSEIGLTLVHEGNTGAKANLQGVDASYQITEKTKLVAELANSKRDIAGLNANGQAWKVEALHNDEKLDARAYIRQQDEGFGLGQQAGGEVGSRKIGAEMRLRMSENLQLQGQAYQQDTLSTGAKRDVIEARADHKVTADTTAYYGGRYAKDKDGIGETRDSKQLLAGVTHDLMDKKLQLRAGTELSLGSAESTDFPNRVLFGADYKLTEQTQLFAEHEFARGKEIQADTTRIGLRVKPWTGAEMAASLGNQSSLDSNRIYSDLGLTQKWQLNEYWQTDFAIDRVQTLKKDAPPQNINVPLTSGNLQNDNTALSVGANYHDAAWSSNARVEWRDSEIDTAHNFLIGFQRNLDDGRVLASGFSYRQNDNQTGESRKIEARLSYAHRPNLSDWIWLNRFDYVDDLIRDTATSTHSRKLINNTNVNWTPNRRTQLAMQYGAKYVFDAIDGKNYNGYTDLMGAELRHDIGKDWDVGAHGAMLHNWNSGTRNLGAGLSVGYKLMDNTWVSIGYNFLGFNDNDFSGAEYRSKGLYATVRMKFDQDTFNLNKASKKTIELK